MYKKRAARAKLLFCLSKPIVFFAVLVAFVVADKRVACLILFKTKEPENLFSSTSSLWPDNGVFYLSFLRVYIFLVHS